MGDDPTLLPAPVEIQDVKVVEDVGSLGDGEVVAEQNGKRFHLATKRVEGEGISPGDGVLGGAERQLLKKVIREYNRMYEPGGEEYDIGDDFFEVMEDADHVNPVDALRGEKGSEVVKALKELPETTRRKVLNAYEAAVKDMRPGQLHVCRDFRREFTAALETREERIHRRVATLGGERKKLSHAEFNVLDSMMDAIIEPLSGEQLDKENFLETHPVGRLLLTEDRQEIMKGLGKLSPGDREKFIVYADAAEKRLKKGDIYGRDEQRFLKQMRKAAGQSS